MCKCGSSHRSGAFFHHLESGAIPPIPAEGGASLTLRFFPPFIEVARTPVDALWLLVIELSDTTEGENASAALALILCVTFNHFREICS